MERILTSRAGVSAFSSILSSVRYFINFVLICQGNRRMVGYPLAPVPYRTFFVSSVIRVGGKQIKSPNELTKNTLFLTGISFENLINLDLICLSFIAGLDPP